MKKIDENGERLRDREIEEWKEQETEREKERELGENKVKERKKERKREWEEGATGCVSRWGKKVHLSNANFFL